MKMLLAGLCVGSFFLQGVFPRGVLADDFLVDDFTDGNLLLPLPADVFFGEVTQNVELGPIVIGPRTWENVWSGIREEEQSATLSIDADGSVFSLQTEGDPFTYFELSYSLFGGYQFSQPLPFNANEAGVDRIRLRFRGDSARIYHQLGLTSESGGQETTRGRGLGGRFSSIPGGILEIPFSDFTDDPEFPSALTGLSFGALRYQGSFELDVIELAGPPLEGDLNRDGVADADDLDYLQDSMYGISINGVVSDNANVRQHTADLNQDGRIDAADYTLWRDAFNAAQQATVSVPEPTALLAVGLALFAAVGGRRRG